MNRAFKNILKILVVDDEILIARNLQRTLIDLGNDVPDVACNAEDALKKVEEIKPNLVFMDIRLASGMDGIEAANVIKDRFGIPVIFLTAYADEETLNRAKEVAPYGYLVKPVSERDVRIITEVAMGRYAAELLLQRSEARNRLILNAAYDAFVGMNEEGNITEWNPQAEIVFGWSQKEVMGRSLRDTIIPLQLRDAHTKGLVTFLKTGHGPVLNKRIEMSALHKNGHEFPVELTISSIKQGESYFFSAFIHDISERKQAEAVIRESELALKKANEELEVKVKERTAELEAVNVELASSNAELEQFAGVAAHDLRAPIKSIQSWIDMLERLIPTPRDEQLNETIRFVRSNAKKADKLIGDLLEVARANAVNTRVEPVNLSTTLQNIIEVHKETIQNTRAQIQVGPLPTVPGNPTYLEAVFSNLIRNALTYRHKERNPKLTIACRETSQYYEFSVQDNGIGIAKGYTERIFEMFKRLHSESEYPGTGIGLAFCKKVVELCGGKIWVYSVLGEGSTFFFTYPKNWEDKR